LQIHTGRVNLSPALGSLLAGRPHYLSGDFHTRLPEPPLNLSKSGLERPVF
jgi:hypothetical protein